MRASTPFVFGCHKFNNFKNLAVVKIKLALLIKYKRSFINTHIRKALFKFQILSDKVLNHNKPFINVKHGIQVTPRNY